MALLGMCVALEQPNARRAGAGRQSAAPHALRARSYQSRMDQKQYTGGRLSQKTPGSLPQRHLILQRQFVGKCFVLLQPGFTVRAGGCRIAGDVVLRKL